MTKFTKFMGNDVDPTRASEITDLELQNIFMRSIIADAHAVIKAIVVPPTLYGTPHAEEMLKRLGERLDIAIDVTAPKPTWADGPRPPNGAA